MHDAKEEHPSFTCPAVLRDVVYEDEVRPSECRRVVLAFGEARELLRSYLIEMTAGVTYTRRIYEGWNTSTPNVLTQQNVENANEVLQWRATRLKPQKLIPVLDRPIPGLGQIPVDADLFSTSRYDPSAGEALAFLDDYPDIAASKASKLLHQKRPRYIPIFDSYARRAINIPYGRDDGPTSYERLLHRARAIEAVEQNGRALDMISAWLTAEPAAAGLQLSRVRIVDILAWSIIRYRDPFRVGSLAADCVRHTGIVPRAGGRRFGRPCGLLAEPNPEPAPQ